MKKITLLCAMLLFSIAGFSQNIIIGTGTDLTDGTDSDPVDGYYNSFKYQVVYTAAELNASLTPYDEITGLGFSVSEDYAGGNLQGYEIKIGHTSAINSSAHDASGTTTVKNAFDYDPTATAAGVFDMISFDANFVWNGIDNVLVEICSAGQNAFSSPYGGVRVTTVADGSRVYRVDGSSACGNNTTIVNGNRPNIQFNYINGTPPACLPPNTLTATSIAAISASLGWTTGGSGEATWDVEVLPVATTATGTPTDTGVTNPFNKTGLTAATDYKFYARANCGGGDSSWVGPFNFTTLCGTVIPDYTNDFSTYPGNCWEEGNDTDIATGPNNTDGGWVVDGFLNVGTTGAARINLWDLGDSDWLVSPTFDLSAGGYELKFDVGVTEFIGTAASAMGSDDEVQVLISNDDGATWINLDTFNAGNTPSSTGDAKTYDLAAYTSLTTKFAFWGTEGAIDDTEDYNFYMDNFIVRTPPSCVEPNTLTATSITAISASLGWTSGGSGEATWDVEVLPLASTATGTPTDTGVANPFNKTGLTATTDYKFYVRANCGGGDSAWSGPFNFTTLCAAYTPAYTQDFTAFPGACWGEGDDTDIATGPNGTDGGWNVDGFLNVGTTGAARINMYDTGINDWLVSPTFDLSAGSYGLAFNVGAVEWNGTVAETPNPMGSDDEVQVLISNDNGATWINLDTFNNTNAPSATGDAKVYDLAAYTSATTKFAFWASVGITDDDEDIDFFIDDFRVDLHSILGIKEISEIGGFVMYPNPVEDRLTISAKNEIKQLSVVNMLGQTIRTVTPNSRDYQLDFSNLNSGIYFVKASVNNTESTFRIVKK